ncbi:MAG: serine/threonine-protein kinase [Gemmatimonadota bacterium]|nr:serine/threonine-protein kinase [Gemmatimonadota bacterium]
MTDASIARLSAALADRYRIERELGAGGMATVYLAHDLKHDRQVAIKVLKPELAAVIGAERFLAEIKTTANLQHPHILPLHDSGEVDGTVFYVMPFVEGESLRDRLHREQQLPVADAVRIAVEVAGALDYAHRRGVIHRDIKPENILLHDGQSLVADFGIALAVSRADGGTRMTETGMSLGTPHYMSPEQAMGEREITARSDVYALGCVLYEMLLGEPPFTGPTAQAIIARVVTEDPRGLMAQRKTIPPGVEAAVHTALQKLPADRFATAASFADALRDPQFATAAGVRAVAAADPRWKSVAQGAGALGVVLLVAALWGWLRPRPAAAVAPELQMYVQGDSSFSVTNDCCGPSLTVSADGQRIVFMAQTSDTTMLYRRDLGDPTAHPIPGTGNSVTPFLSPDGRWLGFLRQGTLMKVDVVNGGAPMTIGPAGSARVRGASWGDDGYVYFTPDVDGPQAIYRVSAEGGDPKVFAAPDTATEHGRVVPHVLPGSHVLLYATAPKAGGDADAWVVALDMDHHVPHRLTPGFQPYYSSNGYLTYALADGSLMARRFDPKTFALGGSPIRLSDRTLTHNYSEAEYAVANDGTMVIRALGTQQSQLRLYSTQGQFVRTIPGNVARHSPRFSPDGHRIAYTQGDYNVAGTYEDVWVYDLTSGVDTRLSDTGNAIDPIWSADGRSVRWLDERSGVLRMMSRPVDQSAPAAPFGDTTFAGSVRHHVRVGVRLGFPSGGGLIPMSVDGPDGTSTELWVMNADGTHARPFLQTSAHAVFPAVSPSGKWLAYASDETGRSEIYVEPFPNGGPRYRITAAGGYYPVWATDTALVYENGGYEAVISSVRFANGDVRAGPPRVIVGSVYDQIVASRSADVSPDGKTLAVIVMPAASRLLVETNRLQHLGSANRQP